MRLDSFPMVQQAIAAREKLVMQRECGRFGVTIDGVYQDDTMIEQVRGAVVAELNRRIAELDDDLVALGVIIT